MSGYANISTVPDQNILYNAASGHTLIANQNALLQQQTEQANLDAADQEQVARAASSLRAITDPAARAAAYPQVLGMLSPRVRARAPATLPDDATLELYSRMGTPSQTQQEWGFNLATNKAFTDAQKPPATVAAPATSGAPATTVTPSGGATIGQRQNNPGNLTFAGQPGASPGQGNRFAAFPDMPTGVAANADQLALYQTQHGINTVRGAVTRWVGDPKADLGSYIGDVAKAIGVGPDDPIDLTNPDVQAKFIQAQFPHESAGGGYVLNPADVQKGVQMAAANRGRSVQAPGTAIATSGAPPGPPAAPAPYRVASNAPVPPPASTMPAAPLPRDQAVVQAQRTGQAVPVAGVDGLWALPNGNLSSTPPAATPQPPPNRVMPGASDGPPAPAPQPAAPAGGPQPPQLQPVNARGLTPLQQVADDAMARDPRVTLQQRIAAQQAAVNQNITLQQKAFSDWIQVQQLQTSQGQLSVAQQNSALEAWKIAHPEAKVTLSGGEIITQNPRNGQEIAPRIKVTPNEAPRTVDGTAVEDNGQWRQPKPGEQGVPGKWTVGPAGGQFYPESTVPAQGGYTANKTAYERNSGQINGIADKGEAAQADQVRIKEMQDQLDRIVTGPGTATKVQMAAWLERWLPNALNPFTQQTQGLTDAAAAEVFNKLAFRNATTQERSVAGSRGAGSRMTEMFLQSNPGLDLLTDANRRMLNVMRIANQADIDKTQGAQDHFVKNEQAFRDSNGRTYTSLESYNADWQRQRNPEVFAAAASAAAGLPARDGEVNGVKFKGWANELNAAEEKRVLEIVARAAPGSRVNTKGGDIIARPQAPATPPMPPGYQPVSQQMADIITDGKGNYLTLDASGQNWVPTEAPQKEGGYLGYPPAPPEETKKTASGAQNDPYSGASDVPGQQQTTEDERKAAVGASGPAWMQAAPVVVGGNAPGYRQSDVFPIARRQDVIDNPNSSWSEGWALAPGPLRALGQTPAENTTINPETGTMNIAPEALASASLLGGTPGLLFGGVNRAYVPPGTLNRGAPLSPEFLKNPLGPSLSERPMPEPGGPTSATGVPPQAPTPEMHAVPSLDSPTPPAAGAAPKTAAEAKQVASQFYQLNAAQGGRQMPSDFINALSDDLNERGPKGPLETAVAGENRVGRIAAQVRELRDQPTSLEDAQRTYSRIGDEATAEFKQNGNSETYRDLMQIQSNMRDRIAPPELTGNDAWTNARKAWSQAMKMDDLERIQQRAELTDNPATSIKSGLRVLLSNPSRIRGYSPEEVQALRDASERGALGSVLHVFGSRLIPIVAASAEAGSGGLTAGLAAAGAAHVGTTAIRAAAEALQTSRLNRALSTLAERVPRNQVMPPP